MTRCKLISPTNLMLERPMLSPVKETEFVLHGVEEHKRILRDRFFVGLFLGAAVTWGIVFLVLGVTHGH
jgi:hypothetical protein